MIREPVADGSFDSDLIREPVADGSFDFDLIRGTTQDPSEMIRRVTDHLNCETV